MRVAIFLAICSLIFPFLLIFLHILILRGGRAPCATPVRTPMRSDLIRSDLIRFVGMLNHWP